MALSQTLQDNFNNNSISASWALAGSGTPANQIFERSQQLEIITSGVSGEYFTFQSATTYDMTASYILMQLLSVGAQAANQDCVPLGASVDANNTVFFSVNGGNIQCYRKVGGVQTQTGTNLAYSATVHKWLRIREAGGTTFWDFSTNSITWTNITSIANPITLTAVTLFMQAGQFGAAASTTMRYDNFNIIFIAKLNNSGIRPRPFAPGLSR